MKITMEEVRETALLARLALSDEELARMHRELDAILGYMDKLAQLEVGAVAPMTHAVPMDLRLVDDAPGPHLPADAALADAPRRQDHFFEVPKIIEGVE